MYHIYFGTSYEQTWSFGVSFSAQYWVKGITFGAIKKLKSSPRFHFFEFLNQNPLSEYGLGAKFELKIFFKVVLFCAQSRMVLGKLSRGYESGSNDLNSGSYCPEWKYDV